MKIPVAIVAIAASAILAVQSWTLNEVVNLKIQIAVLNATLDTHVQSNKIAVTP